MSNVNADINIDAELKKYENIRNHFKKKIDTEFKLLTLNIKSEVLENTIYEKSYNENEYLSIFYDLMYDYDKIMNDKDIKDKTLHVGELISNILDSKILTNRKSFDEINKKIKEQYDYLLNPGIVQSSPFPCKRCGKRTVKFFVFQSKSCDEGQTELNMCQSCRYKWTN
jgi:DNA-directed RNA polymerase subunit M/transcription elongation factor TFIIS